MLLLLVLSSTLLLVNGQTRGTLRLSRYGASSLSYYYGQLQIYWDDGWNNICDDDSFSTNEGEVACHQLGYTGLSYITTGSYGDNGGSTVLTDVHCNSSDYLVLLQCAYNTTGNNTCSQNVALRCLTSRIWNDPYPGMVRLQGGDYSNEGRIEVYCNGEWGTVCDDTFDDTDANTVCKQLGYTGADSWSSGTLPGSSFQTIWLDYVYCSDGDRCIGQCQSCPGTAMHSCVHTEDVTLVCAYSAQQNNRISVVDSCEYLYDTTGPSGSGAIRLVRDGTTSPYYTSGVVQVWWNGHWGNICNDASFGYDEADVICHQLGWSGATSYTSSQYDSYDNDNSPTTLGNLNCALSYLNIFQCTYSTTSTSSCTDDTDVSITCYSTRIWDNPYDGQIRLQRGTYSNQGLVEVYCNGEWGTICDDGFDSTDTTVVCRQLGYNGYYSYDHLSITGNVSQPIWLGNVYCSSSSYSCIGYCENCPYTAVTFCSHSEDITIECSISSSSSPSTTLSTCDGVTSTSTDSTEFTIDTSISSSVGAIVGGTIGGTFFIIFLVFCLVGFSIFRNISRGGGGRTNIVRFSGVVAANTNVTTTNGTKETPAQSPPTYSTAAQQAPPSYPTTAQQPPPPYPSTSQTQGTAVYPQQQYPPATYPQEPSTGYVAYLAQPQQPSGTGYSDPSAAAYPYPTAVSQPPYPYPGGGNY